MSNGLLAKIIVSPTYWASRLFLRPKARLRLKIWFPMDDCSMIVFFYLVFSLQKGCNVYVPYHVCIKAVHRMDSSLWSLEPQGRPKNCCTPETIALWMCQDNVEVMRLNVINLDEDNSSSLHLPKRRFSRQSKAWIASNCVTSERF